MDEYLLTTLSDYRASLKLYDGFKAVSWHTPPVEAHLRKALALEPLIHDILAAVDPRFAGFKVQRGTTKNNDAMLVLIDQAMVMIAHKEKLQRALLNLGPALSAADMHPWVWEAAAAHWGSDEFAVAVEQAAKDVNTRTQEKLAVHDLSDDDLVTQAWTLDDPKVNRPRLRLLGDRAALTWRSRQEGAAALGRGCWKGIRNVHAHSTSPVDRQIALEYLAALSVYARWVDASTVERHESEPTP